MSTVQTAVGRIGWHELLTPDVEGAKAFYGRMLGWQTEVWLPGEVDYSMISGGDARQGGFLAVDQLLPGSSAHWLAYVDVESVEDVARRAREAGGSVVAGPLDVPEDAKVVVVADPHGARIAAIEPPGQAPLATGIFVWDELQTPDLEAAKTFYESAFGWRAEQMQMGSDAYTIFKRGDEQVAGAAGTGGGGARWLTYVAVGDVDETAAKARELGATVQVEPEDIPGIGRFAVIADPQGSPVGLYRSAT
jgi:predicted enzyme related to lactoylglutathione lyase